MPSRVRSPTPAKTETPPCWRAMLWISSWIRTVLPVPAPPKRPILPPFTYGAIRSTTLRPVSKISTVGESSRNVGGSRWIDQRSTSLPAGFLVVDRLADHVPDPAQGRVADGDGDRRAGVDDVDAAREAVGRLHRDRADAIVAEVLLHLRDQRPAAAVAGRHLDRERVVDLRQLVREDGVDDDALDLDDLACGSLRVLRHVSPGKRFLEEVRRAAPQKRSQSSEAPVQAGRVPNAPDGRSGYAARLRRASWRSSRIVCSSASSTSAGASCAGAAGRSASLHVRRPGPRSRAPSPRRRRPTRRGDAGRGRSAALGAGSTSRRARLRRGGGPQLRRDLGDVARRSRGRPTQWPRWASSSRRSSTASSPSGASAAQARVRSQRLARVVPVTAAARSSRPRRRAPAARSRRRRAARSC